MKTKEFENSTKEEIVVKPQKTYEISRKERRRKLNSLVKCNVCEIKVKLKNAFSPDKGLTILCKTCAIEKFKRELITKQESNNEKLS